MASDDEIRALRKEQAVESAGRAAGAKRSPLASSGGGGFESAAPTKVRPAVDAYKPAAPVSATTMGGAQDTGGAPKVYGIDTFSDDDLARGHRLGGSK